VRPFDRKSIAHYHSVFARVHTGARPLAGRAEKKEQHMRKTIAVALAAVAVACAGSDRDRRPGVAQQEGRGGSPPDAFTLVGHDSLFDRGLNAALTVYVDTVANRRFVYIGNRTDGSSRCGFGDPRRTATGRDTCPHPHPG